MKIAFIYDAIYPYVKGGAEKRLWELATRLAACGHEVHLFGIKFWDGPDHVEHNGIHLHGVCRPTGLYSGRRRSIREAVWFALCIIPPLMRERFDLIDCQQFPYFSCISAKIVSTVKRTPLVITWIEVWGDYWYEYLGPAGWVGRCIEKCIARFRNPVIAISHLTARRLREWYNRPVQAVVPVGIDIPTFGSVLPAPVQTDLIFIGRLIREKNPDLLVHAVKILRVRFPGIQAAIIGEGPEWEKIGAMIEENGLGTCISLHPFFSDHRDLVAHLKASKVFVLPSVREGFGITALEALACGLPVVTVDHPANAIRDLITAESGYLSSGTPEDLAEKIGLALENHEAMRASCIRAAEPYDWDRIVRELERFYESQVRNGKG
jgi:glycosyltransferase involved in cell wall biosynthesis